MTTLAIERCQHCNSRALFRERDIYGDTLGCLVCGATIDLTSTGDPMVPLASPDPPPGVRRREPQLRSNRDNSWRIGPAMPRVPVSAGVVRCGAKRKNGEPCVQLVAHESGRCRWHRTTTGGTSNGSL